MELAPGAFHLPAIWRSSGRSADRGLPRLDGWRRARIRPDCPGRREDARAHAVPGAALERQDVSATNRAAADYDQLPAPPLPDVFRGIAREIAIAVGMALEPDVCILNYYERDGRMGLHQDKDESDGSIAAGVPVVSVSLGDTARFLFGGTRRRDPVQAIPLESGDAFVFGGPARLRYHGVSRIVPATAPPELGLAGRFNLTFRQY